MNELEFRKRFRRGLKICSIIGVLILGIGISVLIILNNSLKNIVQEQMQKESQEYKRRILRQIKKDNETLESLAVFMDGYTPENSKEFSKRFFDAKETNSFANMAYFATDGKGVLVNSDQGIETDLDYRSLGKSIQKVVETAFHGENAVSPLFESLVSEHQVFAYAVPVYNDANTKVIGALVASNQVEIFEELMDNDKLLIGNDAVHLVDSNGDLLFSSTDPKNTMNLTTLLYSPYFFSPETQKEMRNTLPQGKSMFCSMTYEGTKYQVYLHPIGINDWYIMCVNNPEGISHIAHQMVNALTITFTSLFVVVMLLLAYVIRMNLHNTNSLIQIAYKDSLTNADNLFRFTKNLSRERASHKTFSLVALNIYQFKFINEILGIAIADDILLHICDCISKMLRDDEFFCRESGDLFFIYLQDTDEKMLRWKIEHLMQEISGRSLSGQKDYKIRLYAGVLVCTGEEENALSEELLITRTRFAMQQAKKLHSTNIHFFDAAIHKKEELENYVESHMHQALKNGEFHLFLQPKIDLKTGKVSGAEALVRWITESGQMIFPDTFIPLFEENGFCIQLDLYMFEQTCRLLRYWIDEGIEPIPISVNQSKLLFFDSDYIPNLESLIDKYKVPAGLITLEILESLVLGHAEELNGKIRRLRAIGFKISMDDFGSGYSSFNTLGSLEIDELKLDRGFLLEVSKERGSRYRMIMAHIVHLTKSLNISTVAEGVETPENEELIQELGCDYGQGYLYSRPVSCRDFSAKYINKPEESFPCDANEEAPCESYT